MIVAAEAGLAAGSERQRSWKQTAASERRSHPKANAKHPSVRSDRSEPNEPRSGLTATIRCGRRRSKHVWAP
jgi:hypothetical protein